MGLWFRRKSDDDEVTSSLLDTGVFRLSESHKEKEDKSDPSPYSFLAAARYSFVLTFALWWLPIIGPIVAGYLTGRKAGKPWIGVLAASISLIIVSLIAMFLNSGALGPDMRTARLGDLLVSVIPTFGPYFEFAGLYTSYYFGAIEIGTSMHLDIYLLTLAFAYFGGAVALQTWQEMGYVARHGGNNMTVAFHNTPNRPKVKSSLLKPRPERTKSSRSTGMSFENMHSTTGDDEDDETTSPVERGVEKAQMDRLVSRAQARRNVSSMSRSGKNAHRGRRDMGENSSGKGDWRFI